MTRLSSSFAFFFWCTEEKGGGGGGGGGVVRVCVEEKEEGVVVSMAAGDTKPDTGYLEAEMGGACMPNGDTDQRLISLGAHFNLTTQNTHTLSSVHTRTLKI